MALREAGMGAGSRRVVSFLCGLVLGRTTAWAPAHADDVPSSARSPLFEKNPLMNKLRLEFIRSRAELEHAASAGKEQAVRDSLDTILGFFESKNPAWGEIGAIGVRERDIWREISAAKTWPSPAGFENLLFLKEYYAFWGSFNALFDCLIGTMDDGFPKRRDGLVVPRLGALVDIERQDVTSPGAIARLETLFSTIEDARASQAAAARPAVSTITKVAPIISSFCQDGEYMDSLGSLIDMQGQFLGDLRAPDVKASVAKRAKVAKVLRIRPDTPAGVVLHRVLEQLYESQGVFLFVNRFQEQVVDNLLTVQS